MTLDDLALALAIGFLVLIYLLLTYLRSNFFGTSWDFADLGANSG